MRLNTAASLCALPDNSVKANLKCLDGIRLLSDQEPLVVSRPRMRRWLPTLSALHVDKVSSQVHNMVNMASETVLKRFDVSDSNRFNIHYQLFCNAAVKRMLASLPRPYREKRSRVLA
jgi:hypothetical protein